MTFKSQTILISFFAAAVGGCTNLRTSGERATTDPTGTTTVVPVPASRAGKGDGAVLLVAEFKGFRGSSGNAADADKSNQVACRWRVVNQATKKSYFLNMKPGSPYVFAQLDPGNYQTGRLGCGLSRVWDLDNIFKDGFVVEPNKVSYIGKINFEFKGDALDTVRKAQRTESAEAFKTAVAETPAGGMPAISGFTAKPIDEKMLAGTDLHDGFDVFAKGVSNPNESLAPLLDHLKTCAKDEGTSDPLRFGRLEYIAVYKQGRFSEMKNREEANGFSDHLRSCVERGMMAYHPPAKTDVEVRVRY